jgi:hypothetical protein
LPAHCPAEFALGELTAVISGGTTQYQYDANGNRDGHDGGTELFCLSRIWKNAAFGLA